MFLSQEFYSNSVYKQSIGELLVEKDKGTVLWEDG